jgi:hypothetical protein
MYCAHICEQHKAAMCVVRQCMAVSLFAKKKRFLLHKSLIVLRAQLKVSPLLALSDRLATQKKSVATRFYAQVIAMRLKIIMCFFISPSERETLFFILM